MNENIKLEAWRQRMKQFHRETQQGLGGFAASVIRVEDFPALSQSNDRDAGAFTNAVIRWGMMLESGTWQLCLACDYEFRSARFARAFVFMQPLCQDPTMGMIVGVCDECSDKDDDELLEIAYQACKEMGLAKGKMEVGSG
jgi:hypothetical protein